ncbi:hypothetical protein Tco_0918518 [Tanacetum coccineum]
MSNLKFAETHNLVGFLEKPKESDRFEGIIDFLNASSIRYALTIQALVDGKRVIVTETSVRRALQLKDAECTECLPNVTIFEQLTLMGYENLTQKLTFYKAFFSPQWKFLIHTILQCLSAKTTAWNEFSSTMTSAEEMDLETAQTNTTAKLPLLKQGEYDIWNLRIEQYFQVQDYALWDVIENGNSFKPAAQTTTNADGSSTTLIPGPVTTDEKTQKKNDVKARSFRRFTNQVNTAYGVSTANTQVIPASTKVSTVSTQVSTANLSDDTVYAFLTN